MGLGKGRDEEEKEEKEVVALSGSCGAGCEDLVLTSVRVDSKNNISRR